MPGLRLQAELLETMFAQERMVPASEEAREAYIRHWLRFRQDLSAPLADAPAGILEAGALTESAPSEKAPRSYKRTLTIAMAALVLIPLVIWLVAPQPRPAAMEPPLRGQLRDVTVRNGERQHLVLPDGSQVWLNAGSRLTYDAAAIRTAARREVELSGEAYFDIAHDEARPFLVKSGQMQIRVLGTAFNVRAYPGEKDIETSLIRGSVEVRLKDRPDDVYILRPHEKLVVSGEKPVPGRQASANDNRGEGRIPLVSVRNITVSDSGQMVQETAWVQNKLVFRAEPFITLAARMERWYGVKFHFREPAREALMFTGIFTTETVGQALQAMQLVHPFTFIQDNENIYIQ
jgi:ferric-dicitrate binding protein FerR (iron transport regulator)